MQLPINLGLGIVDAVGAVILHWRLRSIKNESKIDRLMGVESTIEMESYSLINIK